MSRYRKTLCALVLLLIHSPLYAVPSGTLIQNTASAQFDVGATTGILATSNTVNVTTTITRTPSNVSLWQYLPSAPALNEEAPSQCRTGAGGPELTVGGSRTVYIIGDIPAGALNGQTAGYALVAQVAAGGAASTQGAAITNDDNNQVSPAGTYSNGATNVAAGTASNVADNPATVQTVFNDPAGGAAENWSSAGATDVARNGQASDSDAYQVNAATLTVTKTSSVLSDPVNGASNPKSIPGAIVQYTVTIANGAGAATAQSVLITDSLNTEITAGNLAFDTNGYGAGTGIRVTAPDINGGAPLALTNAADADAGDFTANVVSTNVGNLDAGESATVTFRVVIQ